MLKLYILIFIAALFWFAMFSPWLSPYFNFWYTMLAACTTLTTLSLCFGNITKQIKFNVKDIAIGLTSAILLWFVFYIGNDIANYLFNFTKSQVNSVYSMRNGENSLFIGLALFFWIGPAEEIFWRGYVQRTLEAKGKWFAFIVTSLIYAFVHIWSFNFILFMAALICGVFWGLIYMYNRNLLTVLISHAIWDVAIFIIFPIL